MNIRKIKELAACGFTCSQIANALDVHRQSVTRCCESNCIALSKKKNIQLSEEDKEDINYLFFRYKNKKRTIQTIYNKYGYNIDTVVFLNTIITGQDSSPIRWKYNRDIALTKQKKSQYKYDWCKKMSLYHLSIIDQYIF